MKYEIGNMKGKVKGGGGRRGWGMRDGAGNLQFTGYNLQFRISAGLRRTLTRLGESRKLTFRRGQETPLGAGHPRRMPPGEGEAEGSFTAFRKTTLRVTRHSFIKGGSAAGATEGKFEVSMCMLTLGTSEVIL